VPQPPPVRHEQSVFLSSSMIALGGSDPRLSTAAEVFKHRPAWSPSRSLRRLIGSHHPIA
jgi:hypothetical protein